MADLSPELLALGFIWYVAFLFSTTCHEAAHALAAKIGGDDTAFAGGQVSLNPVPHIQRTLGHGGDSHSLTDHKRLAYRMGQRAVRSDVGTEASAPGGVDGSGGSGHELHADAGGGRPAAAGVVPRLVAPGPSGLCG